MKYKSLDQTKFVTKMWTDITEQASDGWVPHISTDLQIESFYGTDGFVISGNPDRDDWRKALRNGSNATGYLEATIKEYSGADSGAFSVTLHREDGQGHVVERFYQQQIGLYGVNFLDFPPGYESGALARAGEKAVRKLIAKYRENKQFTNGFVTLGESLETLRMIRDRGTQLFRGMQGYVEEAQKMSHLAKRNPRLFTKRLSNLWLEAQYGWLPLAADIEGGIAHLNRRFNNLAYESVKIKASEVEVDELERTETSSVHGSIFRKTVSRRSDRAAVKYLASMSRRCAAAGPPTYEELGFTLENFVPGAWELLPYSFVADYFANIGGILDAWSLQFGSLLWIQRTTAVALVSSCQQSVDSDSRPPLAPNWYLDIETGSASVERLNRAIQRTAVYPRDLVPEFHFRIPGIRQVFNMAALYVSKRLRT